MTKQLQRREVWYTLTAVHATGERTTMGTYSRRVHAAEDGRWIAANYPGWHGNVERMHIHQSPVMAGTKRRGTRP